MPLATSEAVNAKPPLAVLTVFAPSPRKASTKFISTHWALADPGAALVALRWCTTEKPVQTKLLSGAVSGAGLL